MTESRLKIYTVGHSNRSAEDFYGLLNGFGVQVLVDVRSYPFPKYAKQFDMDKLKASSKSAGFQYVYLGRELGGMPKDEQFYDHDGNLLCEKLAATTLFKSGMERLMKGVSNYSIALVCAEENPTGCHRRRLLGTALDERGVQVLHIRGTGKCQTEDDLNRPKRTGG